MTSSRRAASRSCPAQWARTSRRAGYLRRLAVRALASAFAFVPILVANTSLLSALIAERIWHEGATLPAFKFEILAIVAFLMMLVLLPQMFFAFQLERAWRTGAAEYGVLGSHYVDTFPRKWLGAHPHTRESLVGTADIQPLADFANAFYVIRGMYFVPISRDTLLRLGLVIVIPLLPLVLTMIPFDDIVDRVRKREGAWRWVSAEAPGLGSAPAASPLL